MFCRHKITIYIYFLDHILKRIPDHYELVILDNRAGYDELIAATHTKSDITIVVEEEDNIDNEEDIISVRDRMAKLVPAEYKEYLSANNDIVNISYPGGCD